MAQRLRERASSDLTLEQVLKRIDVYGRLAYGGQIIAAMAILAAVALLITCAILPFYLWDDDRSEALTTWLGGWALSIAGVAGGIAFAIFCWRWSGDWITEWPGYAVGIAIAAAANGALAYMLMSTPIPVPISFVIAAGAAFGIGCAVAGHLAGTQVVEETRDRHRAPLRRG
jgi:hypothetical protein